MNGTGKGNQVKEDRKGLPAPEHGSNLITTVTFSSSLPDTRVLLLKVNAGDLGTVTGSAFFSGTPCSENPVRSYPRPSAKKTPQRNNLTAQDVPTVVLPNDTVY